MKNITIDFETYFDRREPVKYSLSSMSTEDYIADDCFEVTAVSAMVDDQPVDWFTGTMDETAEWLAQFEIEKNAITAQHARLEAAILAMRFGIRPKHIFCTEMMANPRWKPFLKSLGLAKQCEFFGLPAKGDDLYWAEGKRRLDFTPAEMQQYGGVYGCNDTVQTRALFKLHRPHFSDDELIVIDHTIRMYSEPQLEGDLVALQRGLDAARERKLRLVTELEVQGITKKILSSGPQFAQLLRDRGVEPPMKVSPSWLKKPENERDPEKMLTYAFGKTDPEFMQLKEDLAGDEELTAILNARTETKSTIEEDRCTRYIKKIERHGVFRCPVVYASTHTQRLGGDESENVLNAPNVDRQKDGTFKSHIRFGFAAPKDHVVVAIDYSQIEARISAVTAGQHSVVEAFRQGRDLYSEFGEKYTGRPVNKKLAEVDPQADKDRKMAKEAILGCIAEGTLVYCRRGLVPIERVRGDDEVWDGYSWVSHKGLLPKGLKETLQLSGIWLTPDHQVWSGTTWLEAEDMLRNGATLHQGLAFARARLPLRDSWSESAGVSPSYRNASENLRRSLPTYDLANCGPNRRFMVATQGGPLLVHNCWFGLGGVTFQRRARGKGLRLTLEEAKGVVQFFREDCPQAPVTWAQFDGAIAHVLHYREPCKVGDAEFLWDEEHENTLAIRLLNGTKLYYPSIRVERDARDRPKFKFQRARDKWAQNLWGGVVMNNWAQANAGILIRRAMVDIWRELRKRTALQVYDEVIYVIPRSEAEQFKLAAVALMTRQWDLMLDLPIAVEAKIGASYGHV